MSRSDIRLYVFLLAAPLLIAQNPQEAALNARLAGEVLSRTSPIADLPVHDYVIRLGMRLTIGNVNSEFTVIRDDAGGSTHEPLSVPGGHVFVPASLILAA